MTACAFPTPHITAQHGLTKREYFAAMALLAYTHRGFHFDRAAEYAVKAADALLKELAK